MKTLAGVALLLLLRGAAHAAGSYVPQATFAVPISTAAGLDADSVGNLYALGLAPGATTYGVSGYLTPGLEPLFSFDTGLSSPAAFAVEPSGIVDVLDDASGFTLKRFTNPGTLVGRSTYSLGGVLPNMISTAIDKANARLYIAYQYTYHPIYPQCLGCGGPSTVTKATINEYDLQGNAVSSYAMPGADYTAGSCYTPTALAADRQGNLWVTDANCQQVLKFSPSGALLSSTKASWSAQFNPRALWTDAAGFLYISQAVCGASGCPWGVVKLDGGGSFVTSFTADSAVGTAWDSRILYLSSSGSQPLRRFVFDSAPSVPAETAPLGMTVQHSSAAALSWQQSSDADGDPVTYTVYLSTDPTKLAAIGTSAQSALTTPPLAFGATYYWQVVAQDSYLGLPLQNTQAPVVSFNLNLANSPPNAFGVVSGTGTAVTRATSANLAWQAAVDPDNDPVVYDVFWGTASQSMALLGTTAATSWPVSGLGFSATYYWTAQARDVYNAKTTIVGGTQTYRQVFLDTPPPVPSIVSGNGTIAQHTFSPQAALAWSSVTDADGDPVAYRLFLGASPQALSLVQDSTATAYNLAPAQLGTTYYWQVVAYDPYAASTTSIQTTLFVLQNNPPAPVVYLTTATSYAQHTTSPAVTLAWSPSTDPDGDAVSYRVDVQTSTGAWPSIAAGGATSLTLGAQLETTYYWRVAASDAFGGASTGAWLSFVVHLANRPPYPIVYTSPSTLVTRATSASLTWQDTGDPDGDPVGYALFLSTNPYAQYLVQQGTATAYALNFQFGTTYYWYVAATDSFGARTTGAVQTFLPIFQDTPPPAPSIVSGAGTVGEHALTPSATLAWSSVMDADGDPVSYRLALGTSPVSLAIVQDGQGLSYNLASPQFGTTYYWQVTAYDPYAATAAQLQSLSLYLRNSPPQPFAVLTGTGTVATRSASQVLSWQNALDPDGDTVTYELDLSTNPAALAPVQISTATSFNLSLQLGVTYYWQVAARDGFGGVTLSGPQSFLPLFLNHPPTAPANQSKTGTIAYHGFAPTQSFFWGPSTDPEGDPFAYSLAYGTDSSRLTVISSATLGLTLPVPLNAAFFYRIVATDIYGASSASPLNWVYYQFTNSPPQPFDVISGTGTVTTRSTSQLLAWSAAVDPDGDAVSYGVFFGTSPAALAPLSAMSQTSWVVDHLAFGTPYFWRVDAYDGFGGTTTINGGTQPLTHAFADAPPSPIVYLSTAGVYALHTASPAVTLGWAPSSNIYGDPITYQLQVQTSTGAWPVVALDSATQMALGLQFETTYFWRVTAADPYGGASTGPWQSFMVRLANQPPYPIVYATTGTLVTRATSTNLLWQDTGDPDSDPVTYSVFVSTVPGAATLVQQGAQTSYPLSFQFGTTYYWSVSAADSFGARTPGVAQTFLPVFQDTPPPAPAVVSGSGSLGEHTLTPSASLSWSSVVDADGDPVTYRLAVGTSPASLVVVQDGASLTYALPSPLFGATYYWQVTAHDPYAATAAPVQSTYLFLKNSPPLPFSIVTGTGTAITRATSQALSWQNAVDPDGDTVTYDLSVSTTPGVWPVVQSSTATSYQLAVQFGATYYWQVTARDGFGGATQSGTQSLSVGFWNPAPTAPVNQSKAGTIPYHGFAPTQAFFWQPSSDAAGDAITYSLAYGTDSSRMAVVSPVPLGFTLPVPLNTAFYYSILATGSYGAVSASPVNWVFYQLTNNPPGAFDVLGTTGTIVTRQTSTTLSWTSSVDPDGDAVSYGVCLGTAPTALGPCATTTKTSIPLGALPFGTTYYWRVDAYDGFGATTTAAAGVQSLVYAFYDPPPSPIVYLSTAAAYSQHTATPTVALSWLPSMNAAGDAISYRLDVQTSTGSWPSSALGAATSFLLPAVFETTYTWRVTAFDPYGGASTGAWLSFSAHLANRPPYPIQYLTPPSVSTRSASFALAWQDSGDPDGDPVGYRLELGTSPSGLSTVQVGTSTVYALTLQYGTTVYYRVTATDSFGATTSGPTQSFYAIFLNDPPRAPNIVSPFTRSPIVKTMKNAVDVSWRQVSDPEGDPITYTVYLGNSAGDMTTLATITQAAQNGAAALTLRPAAMRPQSEVSIDGDTVRLSLRGLDYYKSYYLQITASNPYGATTTTGVQTFALAAADGFPRAYNYPNPFSPLRGGTNIVFNAPPSGYAKATVEVYSELQDLLFKQDYFNIPAGISQVHFDGRDRNGRAFYNGSYIARVLFSGPDDKQVFYFLVVK